jgi:hypothetical protein
MSVRTFNKLPIYIYIYIYVYMCVVNSIEHKKQFAGKLKNLLIYL